MNQKILTALASILLAVAAPLASAHPEPEFEPLPPEPPKETPKKSEHEHHTKIPATIGEIWRALDGHQAQLETTVADKKLADAHDYAFAIRDLVAGLAGKVPEEKRATVEASAKQVAEIAASIDKSSKAGAQKTTEANVKAITSALKALRSKAGP